MNIFLILISSGLYCLSFPTTSFWWFSFIALVPFLIAIEKSRGYLNQIMNGAIWSLAISSGLGYWLFYALCRSYEVPVFKAVLFFGVFVFLPIFVLTAGFIFSYCFMEKRHILFYALIFPSLWTLQEYIKAAIPILLPWGEIGYALIPFHSFIQVADIVGVYGVTFIVAMVNGLLCYIFLLTPFSEVFLPQNKIKASIDASSKKRSQLLIALLILIFAVFLPAVYGHIRLKTLHSEINEGFSKNQGINAELIQGNFSLMERWSGMGFYHRIQQYIEMTGPVETRKGSTVVVWPETTLNSTTKLDDNFFVLIMKDIGRNTVLISGGLKEDDKTGGVFNSAYIISGQGHLMRYDKHILLPYAETSPLIDLLGRYYTAPSQFQKGATPLSFNTPNGNAGISICFEILYPKLIRESVKQGAQFLVNISNDAWFGDTPMPYVHLTGARLRAIENRRYVLRTSNSGFSAVIGPDGKILSQSQLFVSEKVSSQFLKMDDVSLYSKYGDVILYLSAIFLMVSLLQTIFKT